MDLLNVEVLVPLCHIGAFVILVSVCFLFHRDTLGLLLAFIFVFVWASFSNRELILEVLKDDPLYWMTYMVGGSLLVCLAGLGVIATTERRKMEQQRLVKERMRGVSEMAGAACHELNQPLQVISGLSELIQMDAPADHGICEKVAKMKEQVDKIADITSKIMNISSCEAREYISTGRRIIDIERASKQN